MIFYQNESQFWPDQFILVVTISFLSWPNHYGQVQINLVRPKPFWTNQNWFGHIEGQGICLLDGPWTTILFSIPNLLTVLLSIPLNKFTLVLQEIWFVAMVSILAVLIIVAFVATVCIQRKKTSIKTLGHYNGKSFTYLFVNYDC